jgi:predicted metal-dependent hydrolase
MNAHALLEDLRTRGVTLEADGLTLRVAAPEDVATEELHETVSRHKHALIRLLERERKKLEEAERLGLLIKWSKEPGYIAIHDPTTGEWHEVLASECPPWVTEEAKARRQRRGRR